MDDQDEQLTFTPAEVSETIRESMERAKQLISSAKQTLSAIEVEETDPTIPAQ